MSPTFTPTAFAEALEAHRADAVALLSSEAHTDTAYRDQATIAWLRDSLRLNAEAGRVAS